MKNAKIIGWRSPSNIALVKYWGKHGVQLPRNASLSFTLKEAYSETLLAYQPSVEVPDSPRLRFLLGGEVNPKFEDKIRVFFQSLEGHFPFLKEYTFEIHSKNSFPHSSGIASSASGMSALALCLCTLAKELRGENTEELDAQFWQEVSHISRLGSGSAARSVFPYASLWGETKHFEDSADKYAVALPEVDIHDNFRGVKDAILLIHKGEKAVSSRAGHALMEGHPYASTRYAEADKNLKDLLSILKSGDWEAFIPLVEQEAMQLHALMMCSPTPYILMHPNTLVALQKVKEFREETKLPLGFTLDAGPNVHLLYPANEAKGIEPFIREELAPLCQNNQILFDCMGKGPERLWL